MNPARNVLPSVVSLDTVPPSSGEVTSDPIRAEIHASVTEAIACLDDACFADLLVWMMSQKKIDRYHVSQA